MTTYGQIQSSEPNSSLANKAVTHPSESFELHNSTANRKRAINMAYHAGFKVQNITELPVEILSFTDMTFLLCVGPRINKYWNTVVCHTPELQWILFFKTNRGASGCKTDF